MMKLKLNHIIDLEYLLGLDEERNSDPSALLLQKRDRKIFKRISGPGLDRKQLLLGWLKHRKDQIGKTSKNSSLMPGDLFDRIYRMVVRMAAVAGIFSGLLIVSFFLAYHGSRPVNVSFFVFIFVALPLILSLMAVVLVFFRGFAGGGLKAGSYFSIVHGLIFKAMVKLIRKFEKKIYSRVPEKGQHAIEYVGVMLDNQFGVSHGLFFWPLFIITSVFSACFSLGTLAGLFIKVVVSDLAFGWQSTLSASVQTVYALVSAMAWPWKAFVPPAIAHPGIEQIEGSKIILKDGISVLATQDLVSWWPFLCLAVFFYAVVPRCVIIVAGMLAQRRLLAGFEFKGPAYNDLLARMTTPLVSFDVKEAPVSSAIDERAIDVGTIERSAADGNLKQPVQAPVEILQPAAGVSLKTVAFINNQIYQDDVQKRVVEIIEKHLLFNVDRVVKITHYFKADEKAVQDAMENNFDQAAIIQEAWQPPIKGLLFYISKLAEALPEGVPLYIVLTDDAGQAWLFIEPEDTDLGIWQQAITNLDNKMIKIKGLFKQ